MSGNHADGRYETNETAIFNHLERRIGEISELHHESYYKPTVDSLTRRFGRGDYPTLRAALFRKIEKSVRQHGLAASKIVWRVIQQSRGKRFPDRWFCVAVISELSRASLFDE